MNPRLKRRTEGPLGIYMTPDGPVDFLDMTRDELLAVIEDLFAERASHREFVAQMEELRDLRK
jgi:hypothetical protein